VVIHSIKVVFILPICVITDTNFLLLPAQRRIDIFEELVNLFNRKVKVVVPLPVFNEVFELKNSGKPLLSKQATLAITMIHEKAVIDNTEMQAEETVDDFIVRLASKKKCLVATNDASLRRKLRKKNVSVIFLRQMKYLQVDGRKD
jgi:rRNA-processing protein FCF1